MLIKSSIISMSVHCDAVITYDFKDIFYTYFYYGID
jgi:hypothetical protein